MQTYGSCSLLGPVSGSYHFSRNCIPPASHSSTHSPAPKDQLVFLLPWYERDQHPLQALCPSTDLIAGAGSEDHSFLIPWQRIGQGRLWLGRNTFVPRSPALVLKSRPTQVHPSPPLLLGPGSQLHLFGHEPIPYSEADRWRLSLNGEWELTAPPWGWPAPAPPSVYDSCSFPSHPHRPGHHQFGFCPPDSSPL